MKLTGMEAISYVAGGGGTLHKYADPTEEARDGLTIQEARRIAHEDPNLIWTEIKNDALAVLYLVYQALCDCLDEDDHKRVDHEWNAPEMEKVREILYRRGIEWQFETWQHVADLVRTGAGQWAQLWRAN